MFPRGCSVRHNIKLSSIVLAVVVCFCFLPAELFASKKKGSVRSAGSERTAVVQPAASAVPADVGEIDRRSEAANAEITRLTAALAQISQDSLRAAAEIAGKLQSAAPSQAAEAQVAQKMQEIAALRLSRDKARQDSADAVRKIAERFQGFKREASRLDAAVMSASNQLNALSSRRQQVPMEGSGEGARTAQTSRRDHQRVDSLITSKQADLAAWGKRRDQARQDSLALEARISENRIKILNEGRRVDSLVQIATAAMNEMATRQAKARTETSNSPEQAKLTELSKQKFQIEAQLVLTRAEITTSTVDRERLRVAFGDADKKIVQDHLPLAAALASAESIFSDKIAERAALDAVMEMIQLDSAIRKAKDDLNSAIEKKDMNKKGADKLVDQYESDVSTFMGKLDDVRRKNPKATSYDPKISGLVSTADKRKRAETFIGSVNSEIATLTARRDQARRNMENFDRTHPSPARAWAPRLSQLDSTVAVKERAAAQLGLRRDSLENLLVSLKRMVEGFSAAAQAEIRKADSAAAFTKKQWSDLTMQRAQVRGDSLKNESTLSVGLMRLRSEQAKVSAQVSMVDRDIASMNLHDLFGDRKRGTIEKREPGRAKTA